jgi:hypothetical protein
MDYNVIFHVFVGGGTPKYGELKVETCHICSTRGPNKPYHFLSLSDE